MIPGESAGRFYLQALIKKTGRQVMNIIRKMSAKAALSPKSHDFSKLREQYGCGPVRFVGTESALYGKFSSDRTIAEYAAGIWNVRPCPVP